MREQDVYRAQIALGCGEVKRREVVVMRFFSIARARSAQERAGWRLLPPAE